MTNSVVFVFEHASQFLDLFEVFQDSVRFTSDFGRLPNLVNEWFRAVADVKLEPFDLHGRQIQRC